MDRLEGIVDVCWGALGAAAMLALIPSEGSDDFSVQIGLARSVIKSSRDATRAIISWTARLGEPETELLAEQRRELRSTY